MLQESIHNQLAVDDLRTLAQLYLLGPWCGPDMEVLPFGPGPSMSPFLGSYCASDYRARGAIMPGFGWYHRNAVLRSGTATNRGTAKPPAPNAARASLMPRNPTIEKTISQEYGHLQHPGMPSILTKVDTPALSSYFRHCTEEPHPALCSDAKECQASCCFVLAIFACPVCMFLHINMLSIPRERSSATKDGLQYQAVRLYRRLSRPLRLLLLRKALSAVHRCTSWT